MKNRKAFSLIELSIVILVVGILIVGINKGLILIRATKLSTARSLTNSSAVSSVDGLALWLETTSIKSLIASNGQTGNDIDNESIIKQWNDINPQSSTKHNARANGNYSTIGGQYIQNGINSLPILRFNGNTIYVLPDYTLPTGNSPFTMIAVFKMPVQGLYPTEAIINSGYYGASNTQNNLLYDYVNARFGNSFRNTQIYSENNSVLEQKPYIVISEYDATTNSDAHKLYVNGLLSSSAVGVTLNVSSGYHKIGKWHESTGAYLHADLAEIIIYTKSLKNKERRDVEEYLSKKWGIGLESQ